MTTAPTLDELEQSIIDFVIGLCFGEDNKIHGEKAIRDALTSYGTARYDDGVEEERERCKKAILCLHDIDDDTCDCCKDNYARVDDPDY